MTLDIESALSEGGDWSLREQLTALAEVEKALSGDANSRGAGVPSGKAGENDRTRPHHAPSEGAMAFVAVAYRYGWVRRFDWPSWAGSPEGEQLLEHQDAIATATPDQLAKVITTVVRADRFCDGTLDRSFESGFLARVARRARELLNEADLGSSSGRGLMGISGEAGDE